MGRPEEIEAAIESLSPEEYRRVVQWFRVREQNRWDSQLDADFCAGKLDFLFDEAESESAKGLVARRPLWETPW
ncbi:MAG: hypothetical protein ABSE42_13955 [Bryobacteraceae bacterium]|jgi:hypothetical protein